MRWLFPFLLMAAPASADCVVLLHGLARSETSLVPMAAALEARGYRVVNDGYPSTEFPIGDLVPRVGAAVRDVCEESTGPNAIMWFESRCHRFAWNGATPQIEQAVRRARDIAATGYSSIAPVAIRIAIP